MMKDHELKDGHTQNFKVQYSIPAFRATGMHWTVGVRCLEVLVCEI